MNHCNPPGKILDFVRVTHTDSSGDDLKLKGHQVSNKSWESQTRVVARERGSFATQGKKLSRRGKRHRKLQRQQLTIRTQCKFGGASLIKDTLLSKKKWFLYVPLNVFSHSSVQFLKIWVSNEHRASEIRCVTHTEVLQNSALIFNEQFTCKDLWLMSCLRYSDVSNSTEGK